ncbi:foldase protein PrsA [Paenibacillus cellulosilyticus]|uniref:Foldase protein PrsA n=1 Tax=Paenibacillus cellulosilyticus TaxID=375489 RepID=A0A2V2YL85_9BACL|nr:peptidylprolyl isomerase [Paenibacillus cellulosilyticus]PWV89376.1 foldase protein PrsA [Paenibacillus cellulosilyticus]QKS47326.1 peptidylprolyl isomerase [Paenibacillus cellulosilyticus]
MSEENKRFNEQDEVETNNDNTIEGQTGAIDFAKNNQDETSLNSYNNAQDNEDEEAHNDSVQTAAGQASAPQRAGAGGWIASAILLVALLIVSIKAFSTDGGLNGEVGSVNGVAISQSDLYDTLVKGGNGESALDGLITYELVNQEAQKQGITVSDADLDRELDVIKKSMGSEEAFQQALDQYKMTVDDLHADLLEQAQLRKLLSSQINITDEDVQNYYDQNKASFSTEEQVRASHILVATKEEADAIEKQLKEGADFAALAKEKSLDTGSKENGGDLDFFSKGSMVAEFEDAAFSLKVGEVSEPVKSDYGYHIIKVTDRKEASSPTLEEKKEEITDTLTSQKIYELSSTLIQDLRSQAKIVNNFTEATAAPADSTSDAATATDAASGSDAAATTSN